MLYLLMFCLIPIIEIAVLIKVGQSLGVLLTLFLLVLSAVIGIQLLRIQSFFAALKMHKTMQQGQLPSEEVLAGMFLAFAGMLFILPGFVSDFFGFILLLPFVRRSFAQRLLAKSPFQAHSSIIEGEFSREQAQVTVIEINSQENKK